MRFMAIVKASPESENGQMPTEDELKEMGDFNEQLVAAGVMLTGEGLLPSSKGAKVRFNGNDRTVVDGPFSETKELVAGFWILQCKSMEEAVEWIKRSPFKDGEVEIRQIAEAEDFGEAYTDDVRAQEDRIRTQIENQQS